MSRGKLIIVLTVVIGLLYLVFGGKSIGQVTGVNLGDITKIVIYDGRGGQFEPVSLEDEQQVEEFIKLLNRYRVRRIEIDEPKVGWIHSANLYIGDKEVTRITFVDPVIINGDYYGIIRGNLSPKKIDDFLSPFR